MVPSLLVLITKDALSGMQNDPKLSKVPRWYEEQNSTYLVDHLWSYFSSGVVSYWVCQKNVYIVWLSVTHKIKDEFWQNDIVRFTNEPTLDFDISLEIFGANLSEIFKFEKKKSLQNCWKTAKKLYHFFLNHSALAIPTWVVFMSLILLLQYLVLKILSVSILMEAYLWLKDD